jgi:hypothetical protein
VTKPQIRFRPYIPDDVALGLHIAAANLKKIAVLALAGAMMLGHAAAQTNPGQSPLSIAKGGTGASTASAARTNLGFAPTGTSGATIPLLNGNNTYSGTSNFTGTFQINGNTMTFPVAAATLTRTIASGAKALATGAISSATCTAAQTATATGTLTTDVVDASFNGDPTAVTGYVPLTSGMLTIIAYPAADTVNFKVCNNTGSSISPGAITLNWAVRR